MIVHSILILGAFLGSVIAPIVLTAPSTQENKHPHVPRVKPTTDTHFLKG
jgi:hypothetical protein